MENISKLSPYDTAVDESISMYLSFNSTVTDRTMEGDTQLPEIYEREEAGSLKTVIKKLPGVTPLRAAPKSILQELKTFCSTPTRRASIEQLEEGMAALGVAPLESAAEITSGRVECVQICIEETLSACNKSQQAKDNVSDRTENSDSDTNDPIYFFKNNTKNQKERTMEERNMHMNGSDSSNLPSIIVLDSPVSFSMQDSSAAGRAPLSDIKTNEEIEIPFRNGENSVKISLESESKASVDDIPVITISDSFSDSDENKENIGTAPNIAKAPVRDQKVKKAQEALKPTGKLIKGGAAPKVAPILNKRLSSIAVRRSLLPCEPDLSRNRPSRIIARNGPPLAPASKISDSQFVTQIPRLLNKITEGQVTSVAKTTSSREEREKIIKKTESSRKSMLPPTSTRVEKRQSTAQPLNKHLSIIKRDTAPISERSPRKMRRSGILKTTLNSPASTRRSIRRSVAPSSLGNAAPKRSRESLVSTAPSTANKIPLRRTLLRAPPKPLEKEPKNDPSKPTTAPISRENFTCDKCSRTFRLLSSLDTHKKTHLKAVTTAPVCKYCDKKFAIAKALENHLLEKCSKIPTSERKKLLLAAPTVKPPKSGISGGFSKSPNPKSTSSSICSPDEVVYIAAKTDSSCTDTESMPPPSAAKTKKKAPEAHSGIYRTPSKPVVCHPCKRKFESVLSFTEHVLSHSSSGLDS